MAYNFQPIKNPIMRRLFETIFNVSSGHDHDGSNSKLVTAGAPASGALAADATGRAMMAAGYFDAATVLDKFAADSFDNAQLIDAVKDGAFNADAATRALFDDGIWNLAKIAATAKTHILSYQIEDLAANADITARCIFETPAGLDATITSAYIIPQGSSAGIDGSNSCLVKLTDGTNDIVTTTFDDDPAFPAVNTSTSLGTPDVTYKVLSAGEKLYLTVTNGTTANPPAIMLYVTYTVADAA